jgi:DNA-binding transcriptional MerR regulator
VKDGGTRLLSIGDFAALTWLAPSALRYYDDVGLLRPAHVEPESGYRRYARAQVPEGILIRELRVLAMPIAEVRALLEAGAGSAHRRLDDHWRAVEARVAEARWQLASAHRLIDRREEHMGTVVMIDAGSLTTAIRQVLPAAPPERSTHPGADRALPSGVLLDVAGNVLRLVATDGHRLAMRDLVPEAIEGGDASRVVPIAALDALAARLPAHGTHELRLDDLPEEPDEFPLYEKVMERLSGEHRMVETVGALRLRLEASEAMVRLDGFEPPLTVAFDRGYLLAALDAAQGPDVIVEIAGPAGAGPGPLGHGRQLHRGRHANQAVNTVIAASDTIT